MFRNYWKIVPENSCGLLDDINDESELHYNKKYNSRYGVKLSYFQNDKDIEKCLDTIVPWLVAGPNNDILNIIGKERLIRIFENTESQHIKNLRVLFHEFLEEEPIYDSNNCFSLDVFEKEFGIDVITCKKDFDIVLKHFNSINGFYINLNSIFNVYKEFSPRELIELFKKIYNIEHLIEYNKSIIDYIKDEINKNDVRKGGQNSSFFYKISNVKDAEYEIMELKRISCYSCIFNTRKENIANKTCKKDVLKSNDLINLVKDDFRYFRAFTFDKVDESVKEACLDEICDFLL